MALSMDEQRMLAEIERRLAAEDPGLAARMSAFRRPSRGSIFRSARARVIGSLLTVAVVAMVSLMVYAILPFRSGSRTSGHPVTTVSNTSTGQPKIGAGPGTKPAKDSASKNAGKSTSTSAPASASGAAARAASGSTTHQSPSSRPSGAAVHQADSSSGTTAQTAPSAGQSP
jgi:Protein of unknown function (DUF3040)